MLKFYDWILIIWGYIGFIIMYGMDFDLEIINLRNYLDSFMYSIL